MEAFKLALETIIVGLLALPWLAAAIDLLFPALHLDRMVSFVSGEAKVQAAFGVALLSLAYVLGSAVTPLAQEFVDDEHWYKVKLPTERSLKARVYLKQAKQAKHANLADEFQDTHDSIVQHLCQPDPNDRKLLETNDCLDPAQAVFLQEESVVQVQGSGAAEPARLTLLREQLIVLRGATFNLCVLLLLCTFGAIARLCTHLRERPPSLPWMTGRALTVSTWVLACFPPILVLGFALHSAGNDWAKHDVTDPPIMEVVLTEIALIALIIAVKGVRPRPYIALWTIPAALFVASLAYCGWMWTEVVYDQRVMSAYMVAKPAGNGHAAPDGTVSSAAPDR